MVNILKVYIMDADKIKHLEFVQNIITRMNANSFQIKTWTITLATGLLAIYSSTKNSQFILLAIFPVFIFWFLDSYYLNQERKFRGLYQDIYKANPYQNFDTFDMRPDLYTKGKYKYIRSMFSPTIFLFYIPIMVLIIGIYFMVKCM